MSTISTAVGRSGGRGLRSQISGQQWTEAEICRGGGRCPRVKIGSKTQILNVKSWTPDQDDEEVPHGHSVTLNIEALNTSVKTVLYDTGADFLGGLFSNVEVIDDSLNLLTTPFIEDWEGTTPLNDWTNLLTTGTWDITDDGSGSNNVARCYANYKQSLISADDGPNESDVQIKGRFQVKAAATAVLSLRLTGSGTALRGYKLMYGTGNGNIQLYRWTGDGSQYFLTWRPSPPLAINTWKNMAYRIVGDNHYIKMWDYGDPEPSAWSFFYTDSTHDGPGDVGIGGDHSPASERVWWDDVVAEKVPPTYQTSGTWEDSVDVTSVNHYSHGLVTWDETTPAGTTITVKFRWKPTDAWLTATNGGVLPGIEYGQDMGLDSTRETLEFRVELATTDTAVTPAITDLEVYFEPARDEGFKVEVNGAESVIADTTLAVWGRAFLSAGSGLPYTEDPDWSDIYLATGKRWIARDLQTVTAAFSFYGNAIESITFATEGSKYRNGFGATDWLVPSLVRENGPAVFSWTALKEWWTLGHSFEWLIIDKGQAIHADCKWIVGHSQVDDHPVSLLLSMPNITDHPVSVLARAYARDDHPLSMLIQGWQRDDFPLSVLVGRWTINDHPVSVLCAIEYLHDHPMSFLVYGVDRTGMIEVNIISDDTWDELTALGYTRS